MKQEMAQLKVEKRLSDVQWTGKEQNYKKTIQQLQGRVSPPLKKQPQQKKNAKISGYFFYQILLLLACIYTHPYRLAIWRAS